MCSSSEPFFTADLPQVQGNSEALDQRCCPGFEWQLSRHGATAVIVGASEDEGERVGLGMAFGGSDFELA
jgi:hypothetical protein